MKAVRHTQGDRQEPAHHASVKPFPVRLNCMKSTREHWEPLRAEIEQHHGWAEEHRVEISELDLNGDENLIFIACTCTAALLCSGHPSATPSRSITTMRKRQPGHWKDLKREIGAACKKPVGGRYRVPDDEGQQPLCEAARSSGRTRTTWSGFWV
jgi:hypothetical protein